jgi:hypothetical protein
LVRDEMPSMVGVERRVPLATGRSRVGSELAHEGTAAWAFDRLEHQATD